MPLDLIAVNTIHLEDKLNLQRISPKYAKEVQERDIVDFLANVAGRPMLFISHPLRFAQIAKSLGTNIPTSFNGQELQVALSRTSPLLYAGRTIKTRNSAYVVSEDGKMFMKIGADYNRSLNDLGGITKADHYFFAFNLNDRTGEGIAECLNERGRIIRPGLFMGAVYGKNDLNSIGRLTSLVEKITPDLIE